MLPQTPRARVPIVFGLVVMLLAGLSAGSSTAVSATFTKATSPVAAAMSSGTLASPTGLTAVNGTCTILPSARQVNLSWSASASTFATGYVILRSTTSGSGYASIGSVPGRSTTSFVDSTPAASTTYFYVVRATRNNWLSANSNEASIATPTVLCV
jgi:hypothetical protein